MTDLKEIAKFKVYEGTLTKYSLISRELGELRAQFNLFIPANASQSSKVPLLTYLAGLECTEDTAVQKGGFLRDASAEGIAILFPDTSPRGAGIPGEDDSWDFGTGAGFYVDSTDPTWSKHYRMRTHVRQELPSVLQAANFPIDFNRQSIFGHSMGGHGALTIYLSAKEGTYRSASAFAPISNPTQAPWGIKAFNGYLKGGIEEARELYDTTELIRRVKKNIHIMIDYGTADKFLKQGQLHPENFLKAARDAGWSEANVQIRAQDGYDHSYYFISTFAPEHIQFHAKLLKA